MSLCDSLFSHFCSSGPKFWGVQEDLDGFTEFMRVYLEKYDRWLSPLYLAGE